MVDLTQIAVALKGIKTATEIAKFLKDADKSLEKAELKLKIAELISVLADSKLSIAEIQGIIQEKESEIADLKRAFEIKEELIRYIDVYYFKDSDGNPNGDPICPHCWEEYKKVIHLYFSERKRICPSCKTRYDDWRAPTVTPKYLEENILSKK